MIRRSAVTLCVLFALAGCNRDEGKIPVSRVRVSEAELSGHPSLGLTPEVLADRAGSALRDTGRFVAVEPDQKDSAGREAYAATVEIDFVRALPGSPMGEGAARAEVGVRVTVARTGDRLQGLGAGTRDFLPGDAAQRAVAFAAALDAALVQAVGELSLQADARKKTDAQLLSDLESPDVLRRDVAVRALADRKSPAAVPHLLERLTDPDREVQLRAVGALVAIGDPSVATKLIDATHQRDPAFVAHVAYALGDLGGADAEAYLFTASAGHPDPAVRDAAEKALETLRSAAARRAERQPLPAR